MCFTVSHIYFFVGGNPVYIAKMEGDHCRIGPPGSAPAQSAHVYTLYTSLLRIAIYRVLSSSYADLVSIVSAINETVLVDMSRDSAKLQFLQVTTKPIYRWACLDHLAAPEEIEGTVIRLKANQHLVG